MSEFKFTRQQYIKALMECSNHLTEQGRKFRLEKLKTLTPSELKKEAQDFSGGQALEILARLVAA